MSISYLFFWLEVIQITLQDHLILTTEDVLFMAEEQDLAFVNESTMLNSLLITIHERLQDVEVETNVIVREDIQNDIRSMTTLYEYLLNYIQNCDIPRNNTYTTNSIITRDNF